jgi:mono/diheme cytochrome c family protein
MNVNLNLRRYMPKILIMIPLLFLITACSDQGEDKSENSMGTAGHQMGDGAKKVSVKTPNVPFEFGRGKDLFIGNCAACHGNWGGGTDQGPPLMHDFYKLSHHGDAAFYRAVKNGVKAHHWGYGNMPPITGLAPEDVAQLLPFIRWLQKENGIY